MVPDVESAVVDARMLHVVLADRLPQHEKCLLVVELGRVHADEGHFREILELALQILELCNHMHAVDAATRPEVHNKKLISKLIVESQRRVIRRVQPVKFSLTCRLVVRNEERPALNFVLLPSLCNF